MACCCQSLPQPTPGLEQTSPFTDPRFSCLVANVGYLISYGLALRSGWGVVKNERQGFEWLKKASDFTTPTGDPSTGETAQPAVVGSEMVVAILEVARCFQHGCVSLFVHGRTPHLPHPLKEGLCTTLSLTWILLPAIFTRSWGCKKVLPPINVCVRHSFASMGS